MMVVCGHCDMAFVTGMSRPKQQYELSFGSFFVLWVRWCTWLDEVELLVVVVIRYYISIVKKDITKKYIPKSSRHVKSRAPPSCCCYGCFDGLGHVWWGCFGAIWHIKVGVMYSDCGGGHSSSSWHLFSFISVVKKNKTKSMYQRAWDMSSFEPPLLLLLHQETLTLLWLFFGCLWESLGVFAKDWLHVWA